MSEPANGASGPLPTLLTVDDDVSVLSQLNLAFDREYRVIQAEDPRRAWALIQEERPDLVTLDLALERGNPESGFSLLEKCLAFDPLLKVIMITGNDTRENALRAVKQGAFDLLGKPPDLNDLRVLLRRALAKRSLEAEAPAAVPDPGGEHRLGNLLGRSPGMKSVFRLIRRVAPSDVTVLILGESGTGKEVVAKEIHRLSSRSARPFVSISCAAIPENLLESELFGHEKGAFTSAHTSRPGRLELANTGTVFLDEIGDMPLPLQVKILRFLQEREIERVGGRKVIPLDVRVIAATNRKLDEEVAAGRFREDLFYRLSVIDLRLPRLRDRSEDILLLADHFLERFAREHHRGQLTFSRTAKEALRSHPWPGHVREMEHRVQRAALLANGRVIHPADLELGSDKETGAVSLREARELAEQQTVEEALRRSYGNISKAARDLGISRPTLHDLLRKLGIEARSFRENVPAGPETRGN